jgi:hypothetical protein
MVFEQQVAAALRKLPAQATLLMQLSDHPGAAQQAGIVLRRVVHESNSPSWQEALANPAHCADYVIMFPGDEVSYALRRGQQGLKPLTTINPGGRSSAVIYRSLVR